ncbi:F5/8 type C domain [Seminavis robusta]|uniref:F5/8 type C domain n=1 Tax=Seminavis robusta TaxID=568900 RepID=A0A9N8DWV4_9STRA|nr:F5/8 type C domain [Seminavis robusta]|eukprot:Sro354_g124860.1 F5/8 type C domain (1095) ;mRNA; f:58020-61688
MLYQYADGCSEYAHRNNLKQWIASQAIKDPSVTTWVYFNAYANAPKSPERPRWNGPICPINTSPLEDVWTQDGSQLLSQASNEKYEGGMYLTYDHSDQKMKVYKELPDTENSLADLDSFASYALVDCLTKGSNDAFLTVNTHGAEGKQPQGGRRRRIRNLRRQLQTSDPNLFARDETDPHFFERDQGTVINAPNVTVNEQMVEKLKQTLENLPPGGPDKFSVIGFDHHFIQGFSIINQFKSIARSVIGSQSFVPDHGWSFDTLTETSSAQALAKEISKNFVDQPQQENGEHANSKTISVVDTGDAFSRFVSAFNDYLGVLMNLLGNGNDTALFTFIHRARVEAIVYNEQYQLPDLGSLFEELNKHCDPKPDSELHAKSMAVIQAYNSVFHAREFGPGTVEGTGMYVEVPIVEEYRKDPVYWDKVLFPPSLSDIPNYMPFWKGYTQVEKVFGDKKDSVCRGTLGAGGEAIFIDPEVIINRQDNITVATNLGEAVVDVEARYGLDISNQVDEWKADFMAAGIGAPPPPNRHLRRDLQSQEQAEEYLVMYGGNAPGEFDFSPEAKYHYSATWDRKFHVIMEAEDESTYQPLFLDGPLDPTMVQRIPIIYFGPETPNVRDSGQIPRGTPVELAKGRLGGNHGTLEFHMQDSEESYTLWVIFCDRSTFKLITFDEAGEPVFSDCASREVRPDQGGFLAPIVPVRAFVSGRNITEIVGGTTGRLLRWSEDVHLHIESKSDSEIREQFGTRSVVIEMEAKSSDSEEHDFVRHTFDLTPGEQGRTPPPKSVKQGDLAKCKPAVQSTTIQGAVARQAVSGDLVSLAHTDRENAPWWTVDLLDDHKIDSVVIVNRQDCCQERLDRVTVELLDEAGAVRATVQHNPDADGPINDAWTAFFDRASARKVRVSTQWPAGQLEFLNLASVQVYGDCTDKDSCEAKPGCRHGDIAFCKAARQSSTIVHRTMNDGHEARRAVDGTEHLAHTECERAPWWIVDLASDHVISHVVVKNREDCCFERLDGLKVELLDASEQVADVFQHDPAAEGQIKPMLTIPFNGVVARKVLEDVHPSAEASKQACEVFSCKGLCVCIVGMLLLGFGSPLLM